MLHEDAIKAVREYLKEKTGNEYKVVCLEFPYHKTEEYIVKVVAGRIADVVSLYNANINHNEYFGMRNEMYITVTLYIPEDEIRRVQLRIAKQKDVFSRTKEYNIYVGKRLRHKPTGKVITIEHIHSKYGWVLDDAGFLLKQDLKNIDDFKEV